MRADTSKRWAVHRRTDRADSHEPSGPSVFAGLVDLPIARLPLVGPRSSASWFALSLALALAALAAPAAAEPHPAGIAESLFVDGRRELGQGNVELALARFQESHRLDPSPGTLLNIALCYSLLGKTASAWAGYREAHRLALVRDRKDVAEEAERQGSLLEPTLSYVTLDPAERLRGLRITLDGLEIQQGAFGSAVPADPGRHTIVATAPGYRDWSATVELGSATRIRVEVPKLEAIVDPPNPPGAPPVPHRASPAPWILGGVGLAGLAAGATFAILANDKNNQALAQCASDCNDLARQYESEAFTLADTSTVLFAAGAPLLAAGITWWILDHPASTSEPSARLRAQAGTRLWLGVEGTF